MVADQLASPARGITNVRVLAAMAKVPREKFVPANVRYKAYQDIYFDIGYGQTISQPYVVAGMTELLDPQPTDRVLEIGTGSGYQAAVLAELSAKVYTIEIIQGLAVRAANTIQQLGYTNVLARIGDGYLGWPDAASFDAIMVTCAPEKIPQPLIDQLKDGGRMVIPVGVQPNQQLILLRKFQGQLTWQVVRPIKFVPMLGQAQKMH